MKKSYNINSSLLLACLFLASCGDPSEKKVVIESEEESKESVKIPTLPFYSEASFTPHWLEPNDDVLSEFHEISDFSLLNQKGEKITEKSIEDKIYVVSFFFTSCPGICPKMMANMLVLQEEFMNEDDFLLLSHTVTPQQDTVSELSIYADKTGVKSKRWHLLTGDRKVIYDLGRKSYFIEEDLGLDKSDDEFLHTENIVLVDKNRRIRGIYNGLNKTSVNHLIADVYTLKNEY